MRGCHVAKQRRKLTAADYKASRERKKKYMTIFTGGKQKRVPRSQIDGMDVDEFIHQNADPIWLHQNGMWEYMACDDEDDGPC